MKPMVNRALRRAVMLAQESDLFSGVKPFLKSVLLEGTLPLSSVVSGRSFANFMDEKGNEFKLIEGLRDAIKPGWQWVLQPDKEELPNSKKVHARSLAAEDSVKKALSFLECFGFRIEGKTALEIGCDDGSKSFSLAAQGAAHVTGSDIAGYYVHGVEDAPDSAQKKLNYLEELRNVIGAAYDDSAAGRVRFVEDDITESGLPSSSFDFICSWEVLEHVREPARLFAQIGRLLRPGGIAFHEYNPFFSINGGHSWCTLDFLWGHVLLRDKDFERYVTRFRPEEAKGALGFYREGLNRMTLGDLERQSDGAGLKTLAILPWAERAHLELLSARAFRLARENYPAIKANDLAAPFVWVVQEKS
ncbi:MAG: class I SAM-dependent methyltransferase [Nitrospiraceae bacterium]|nr:class I SAM-dependent methyltransferase [Nitrospiraceae bacterium]